MDDTGKSLAAVLGYLVGRPLKLKEITEALQISRSRYYAQIDEGKLITADNLVRAAENLDVNEVELLARFGVVRDEAVLAYADALRNGAMRPPAPSPRRTAVTAAQPGATPSVRGSRRKIGDLAVRPNVTGL